MFDLTVDYFQLDDQRSNAQFPVVISPTTKNSNTPALTLKLATRNDRKRKFFQLVFKMTILFFFLI